MKKIDIAAIQKVSALDELSKLGTVEQINRLIAKELAPLKISASSYDELFECIKYLQENYVPFRKGFFISNRQEYIYYILQHEGKKLEALLGITDEVYSDPKKAKSWYRKITHIIRPDLGDCENAKNAFQKLQEMYRDLTEENAFGDDDV